MPSTNNPVQAWIADVHEAMYGEHDHPEPGAPVEVYPETSNETGTLNNADRPSSTISLSSQGGILRNHPTDPTANRSSRFPPGFDRMSFASEEARYYWGDDLHLVPRPSPEYYDPNFNWRGESRRREELRRRRDIVCENPRYDPDAASDHSHDESEYDENEAMESRRWHRREFGTAAERDPDEESVDDETVLDLYRRMRRQATRQGNLGHHIQWSQAETETATNWSSFFNEAFDQPEHPPPAAQPVASAPPPGLSDELLNELRWTQLQENSCPICIESYTKPISTVCGHLFCRACLQKWMRDATTCATCRRPLCDDDFFSLIEDDEEHEKDEE